MVTRMILTTILLLFTRSAELPSLLPGELPPLPPEPPREREKKEKKKKKKKEKSKKKDRHDNSKTLVNFFTTT